MLKIDEMKNSKVIGIEAKPIVTKDDYQILDPVIERKARLYGKIRMLIDVGELKGVLLSAFWEDLKMSVNHPSDFEKVAIVSSNNIEDIFNKPIAPLIHSEVKIFDKSQRAKQWILD
ncbi:MAG: STAS/SEC14 domain-containing protein [Thiohalospira sp.]